MMETDLDEVEEGTRKWVTALRDFYGPFMETLAKAEVEMKNMKAMQLETDVKCKKCGSIMVIRWGRHGEFLACSKYPECKSTSEFRREEGGAVVAEKERVMGECDKCGGAMIIKRGKFGEFLACSKYPECKNTKPIPTGVKCPKCTEGELVQRRSRRGKYFYGCHRYPDCDFASWNKPIPEPCPQCKYPFLVLKYSKKLGNYTACPQKECGYTLAPE